MRAALLVGVLCLAASRSTAGTDSGKDKKNRHKPAATSVAASMPTVSTTTYALPLLAAPTQPLTVPFVMEKFEAFDKSLASLTGDFTQFVRWDESGMKQTVEGSLEFRKPDLLRLAHRLPEAQTLVSDGTWLWIYRASTNQVIKTRFSEWKQSEPMAQGLLDFGNYANLLKSYDVTIATASAPEADGHATFSLVLKPREKERAKDFTLTLRLSTRNYFPGDTELRAGGVVVHSVFANIRYNPPLADARFQFTPPPGADVFDNFKPPQAK